MGKPLTKEHKLIAGVMGQDCMRFLGMCLESLKNADKIVYIDGGSTDGSVEYAKSKGCEIIINRYDQEDREMNGRQRNVFLDHLKKHYPNDWCIFVDADEVVEDLSKIKDMIQDTKASIFNVHMRHLIGDLSHEDSVVPRHYVQNRLFKISAADKYPEIEHPVLQSNNPTAICDDTTIWHLAYCPNMWEIKKRYDNHLAKSNMHTPEYLKQWRNAHLFGTYPRRRFNTDELPEIILNNFGVDKDELYFENRKHLDTKHFLDAIYLKEFLGEGSTVMEFGCGIGMRVWCMNKVGLNSSGVELSKYAVKESFMPDKVVQGSILDYNEPVGNFDMTMAYDVLEHIKYEDLDKAINTLITFSDKYIITSIPYKGTPNCEADSTHIIKESEDWWRQKFLDKKLKEVEVPAHFLYREQLLIFEK